MILVRLAGFRPDLRLWPRKWPTKSCCEYLPFTASGLDDARVSIHYEDGLRFIPDSPTAVSWAWAPSSVFPPRSSDDALKSDTAELLYYYYIRGSNGMYESETPQEVVLGEFDYLFECYNIAREKGYIYFEANSLQAFAEQFMDSGFTAADDPPDFLRG